MDSTRLAPDVILRPSWLGRMVCDGGEDTIQDCADVVFGDARLCDRDAGGEVQRLACSTGK